ncbi:MAG: 4Fe-4S binding protein [Chloroflexi bacterium]|nr:4Fe-4S binding protein [Chloroflexota bacterium]
MAYKIIDTCTACGLCVPECPIDAITVGDPIYVIDDTCCDFEDCLAVCPVAAIIPVEADNPLGNLRELRELGGTKGTYSPQFL